MNKNKKLELVITATDLISLLISNFIGAFLYLILYKDNQIFLRQSFVHTMSYFVMAFIVTSFFTASKNRLFLDRNNTEEAYNIVKNALIIGISFAFLAFVMKDSLEISRGVFFCTLGVFLIVGFIGRMVIKRVFPLINKNGNSQMIIVSTYDKANSHEIINQVVKGSSSNVIGFFILDKPSKEEIINGYPVIGDAEMLIPYCKKEIVDSALFLLNNHWINSVEEMVETLQSMGIIVHLGIDVLSQYTHFNRAINYVGNYPVLSYAETLQHEESLILKRVVDIAGGIVGSMITLLVMLILGPIIKLESPGPILFKQQRVGKNGRYFNIYKFRSMGIDAEQRKNALMEHNEIEGHMFKMTNDPRITKVGKFIRATSIDELPQFFNVLKGDMSLVGTRPPTTNEYINYETYHKRRLSMKPGITGMWQVSGRSDITDFEEVVRLDLEYIDNYSLLMDAKILSKTFVVVFAKIGSR